MQKNSFTYKHFLVYLSSAIISLALSSTFNNFKILSLPFFISLLYLDYNPIFCAVSYLIGFLNDFTFLEFYSALLSAGVLLLYYIVFAKKYKRANLIIPTVLSNLCFLFFDNGPPIVYKVLFIGVSITLTFIFITSSTLIYKKNFNYKSSFLELACLSIFVIAVELGLISLFGINAVKALNYFLILSCSLLFKDTKSLQVGVILAIPLSLFLENLYPFAIYSIISTLATLFLKTSKLLSALSVLAFDLFIMLLTDVYGTFYYEDLIFLLLSIVVYLFMPNFVYKNLSNKINSLSDKYLTKHSINRARETISNRLYEVSNVFYEMEKSFTKLKNIVSTDEDLLNKMADEVYLSVCENCPQYLRCKERGHPSRRELLKILSVGIAKNRVSLVDLTKNFTANCGYVNGIIYEINLLIGKYREKVKESEDVYSGKELIRMQSEGVAGVLKGMAFDFSKTLDYSIQHERFMGDELKKKGIIFNEIMCFLNNDEFEYNIVIKNDYIKNGKLLTAVKEITGKEYVIVLKTAVSLNTFALTLKRAPILDAAFGIAVKTKDGSTVSGDTHSLTKIDEGKFLIALSDGMGSGLRAENTSSTAISLIESFYKAGLDSKLILSMVNKILALNTDDNFSAMDVLTVNLFDLTADFVKIGAPYSFILSDSAIKIVEGSSLPLGILDDLSPTGCTLTLQEGCMVIMITDGVSYAFGSSTDLVDFLRTLDNRNPQYVADCIINKALNADRNVPKDDMSVLAVRIFKKVS